MYGPRCGTQAACTLTHTRAGTAGRRQAFRALKAGAGKEGQGPHFSQGYRRGSERRQRSSLWFTATRLHDCHATRHLRARWEQPSVVGWQEQTERKRHGGKKEKPRETERERFRGNEWEVGAESGRLILWIYVVCFQSAEWHFLSLWWGKWSVSAPVSSLSLHLTCRAITTGTYPPPPPPPPPTPPPPHCNSVKSASRPVTHQLE